MKLPAAIFTIFLVAQIFTDSGCILQQNSTAESAVDNFFKDYLGDGKKLVTEASQHVQPGDIEIRTRQILKWQDQPLVKITVFYLRQTDAVWNVIGYHAYPGDSPNLEMR